MTKNDKLQTLADLYEEAGDYPKAEELFRQVCAMKEQVWGPDYPAAGTDLYGLALLCYAQDKFDEAQELLLKALILQRRDLGTKHPDVIETLNALNMLEDELQEKGLNTQVKSNRRNHSKHANKRILNS